MKRLTIVGLAVCAVACAYRTWADGSASADGATSNSTFVYLRPELSSFWHTATGSSVTLPVTYPFGASKATLTVRGTSYLREHADITGETFALTLPAAMDLVHEDVYDLTLTFDNGDVRTARLGQVQGYASADEAGTRCLLPVGAGEWNTVTKRGVLPIPYGTTAFTLNGETVDPGLDGAQGWYALGKIRGGQAYDLSLTTDEDEYVASLIGTSLGLLYIFK